MAVAWSADGAVANIQCSRGAPPKALSINGAPVREFRALESAVKGRPVVVAARMSRPVRTGENVLLELDFGTEELVAHCAGFLGSLGSYVLSLNIGETTPAAVRRGVGGAAAGDLP